MKPEENLRKCHECSQLKEMTAFHRNKRLPLGHGHKCKLCYKAYRAKHYRRNKDKILADVRFREYGVSKDDYSKMLKDQGNKCAICLTPFGKPRGCHVDHCHKTGKVRGLLCFNCNRGLGAFKDLACVLQAAMKYLEITS